MLFVLPGKMASFSFWPGTGTCRFHSFWHWTAAAISAGRRHAPRQSSLNSSRAGSLALSPQTTSRSCRSAHPRRWLGSPGTVNRKIASSKIRMNLEAVHRKIASSKISKNLETVRRKIASSKIRKNLKTVCRKTASSKIRKNLKLHNFLSQERIAVNDLINIIYSNSSVLLFHLLFFCILKIVLHMKLYLSVHRKIVSSKTGKNPKLHNLFLSQERIILLKIISSVYSVLIP